MKAPASAGRRMLLAAILPAAALAPDLASACPSCYGNASGPMIEGLNMAILAMVGVTGFVLTGLSAWFVNVMRRAKKLGLDTTSPSTTEQD